MSEAPLHCRRCRFDMPLDGLPDTGDRQTFAKLARESRIQAILWLRDSRGASITDGKVLANHVSDQRRTGERCCYKCRGTEILDAAPCPRCGSLVLDW